VKGNTTAVKGQMKKCPAEEFTPRENTVDPVIKTLQKSKADSERQPEGEMTGNGEAQVYLLRSKSYGRA